MGEFSEATGAPDDRADAVVNFEILVNDLRRAVEYGSRAGLLREKEVLDAIKAAEQTIASGRPDVQPVLLALNAVAQAIAPITVADLTFGRDPFAPKNQARAKTLQLWLAVFSLIVLALIGYSMNALREEQGIISEVNELQELKPQAKLTALRMIAQNDLAQFAQGDREGAKPTALLDEYHQRASELKQINDRMAETSQRLSEISLVPLLPMGQYFSRQPASPEHALVSSTYPITAGQATPADDNIPHALNSTYASAGIGTSSLTSPSAANQGASSPPTPVGEPPPLEQAPSICAEDADGRNLRLPSEATSYPSWMRNLLADTLSDFCFQLKVLSPGGQGSLLTQNQSLGLALIPKIRDKMSIRVTWFLPFLYGLLGSAIYMMRNVASVRTPAMEWFPIVMRLSLGGVAGIVMGWFVAGSSSIQTTASLSVPFALAFLTGYGIDALFSLLDRISRTLGDVSAGKAH